MSFIKEFWEFLRVRKKFGSFVLVLFGGLIKVKALQFPFI